MLPRLLWHFNFVSTAKDESFPWTYADDDTPPASCYCNDFGYTAKEDASYARRCTSCGRQTERGLEDEKHVYWWCSGCNKVRSSQQINQQETYWTQADGLA